MATKITTSGFTDFHFVKAGIDVSQPLSKQPARPMANKLYARTTPHGVNVRTFEPSKNRDRGGSRPGLSKYIPAAVVEGWILQNLTVSSIQGVDPPGGDSVQTSQSGRVVSVVAVSQGKVYVAQPGDTSWSATINGTADDPPLNYSGLVYSTQLNQLVFFFDGINAKYYDPNDNTVKDWVAAVTAGELPHDDDNRRPRIGCAWRGRLVQASELGDPQNWFMSRKDDPFDWEYGSDNNDVTQAVSGNNSPAGTVGDSVNSLVPYTDDVLIMGGDKTVWMFNGDPMYGGQIDLVSDTVGFAFGNPWCKDPFGAVYFFSSRNSIFRLVPGQPLVRISAPIQRLIDDVDTGNNSITMAWDERSQGFHLFITPLQRDNQNKPKVTTHYFWESRSNSYWQDEFVYPYHNPLCCAVMDGNDPGDRVVITGGWDGYVRSVDRDAETDDGKKISSSVVIGPILTDDLEEMMLKNFQAILGSASGDVTYEVLIGDTAEEALESEPVDTGTWEAGRNPTDFIRRAGYAIYVRLTSAERWQMESIRAEIVSQGKGPRMRGRSFNKK